MRESGRIVPFWRCLVAPSRFIAPVAATSKFFVSNAAYCSVLRAIPRSVSQQGSGSNMHGWSCFMRLQSGWRILEDRRDICKGWRPLGLAVSGRRQGRPDRRLLPEPKSRCECCKDLSPPYDEELAQANRRRSRWTPMRHRIAPCGKVGDTCAPIDVPRNTVVAAGAPCARRARARRHKTGAVNRGSNPWWGASHSGSESCRFTAQTDFIATRGMSQRALVKAATSQIDQLTSGRTRFPISPAPVAAPDRRRSGTS
jgi:hypothetical protein